MPRLWPLLLLAALVGACASATAPVADPTPPDAYVNDWSYVGVGNEGTYVVYRSEVWRCNLADPDAPVPTDFLSFDWSCVKDLGAATPIPGTWPGCDAIPVCRGDE